jgi:hypothetical protein
VVKFYWVKEVATPEGFANGSINNYLEYGA